MIQEYFQPSEVDILLVDDTPDNLRILSTVLKEEGYRIRQVTSGERALEAVAASQPDLILLDIHMPGMDGFAVCEALKADEKTAQIPIIFVTAQDSPQSKVHGFSLGGADYITKPFYTEEVLARVKHQLTIRHLTIAEKIRAERMERILSMLPVATVISRPDGTFCDHNPAFSKLLALDGDCSKIGSAYGYYVDPNDRDAMLARLREEGEVRNFETKLLSASGRQFWALMTATMIPLDGDDALFVAINDISERKEMEMQLEKLATTDFLTNILNRRSFTERAALERERSDRAREPLSLFLFDVDHFKVINDTWGHNIGDLALQHLVSVVNKVVRPYDVFGRVGGEEFALLLPNTTLESAQMLAERVRCKIEESPLRYIELVVPMHISGGVTEWEPGASFETVFKTADKALFKAKETGRNKILAGIVS